MGFWDDIVAEYVLSPVKVALLGHICREVDLIERLQKDFDGLSSLETRGSIGQRVIHPVVSELRQHRSTLAGLLRRIGRAAPANSARGRAPGMRVEEPRRAIMLGGLRLRTARGREGADQRP